MQSSENAKRVLGLALRILTLLVVAFTVLTVVFTVFTVSTVDKNERSVFGIRFYIVQTDSMSRSEKNKNDKIHFNAGDIVLIKKVKDPRALESGDVIAFISTNSDSYGETITHRIRDVKTNGEGKVIGYVTYGTNTGVTDEALVEPEYVLGKYVGKLPFVGRFFAFVKTTPGYIVCILTPFLLLILYNGTNVVRLFRKYRAEQTERIRAERAELAAEREENRRMMEELMKLKEQLERTEEKPPYSPRIGRAPERCFAASPLYIELVEKQI